MNTPPKRRAFFTAFLAAVAEGRVDDVLDRLVFVGHVGDDGGVLAAGLGRQVDRGRLLEDAQAGVRAAGEDDAVHQRAGGEHRAVATRRQDRHLHDDLAVAR